MTTSTVQLTECLNCRAMLDGGFCSQCGQKATSPNPSFGEFLHDLLHEVAHVDGKIVQSVRLLLTRPGFLSREHFEGRRARYITPIRLYLLFSVLYFAVVAVAPLAGPRISCTSCPPEDKARVEGEMREMFAHWTPRAMFVLLPVFAGLVAIAARRSGRNYPQHLYFGMHVHAAWFFAGVVAAAAGVFASPDVAAVASTAAILYALVYFLLAFRQAYRATLLRSIVGTTAVAVTYLFVVGGTLLLIVLPVVYRR